MSIDISDLAAWMGELDALQKSQLRYAATRALSDYVYSTGKIIKDEINSGRIDRPVPFTQNAGKYERVTGESAGNDYVLRAVVKITDQAPKGNRPDEYLFPVSSDPGAGRAYRMRFTRALNRNSMPGYFAQAKSASSNPKAKIDAYGNIDKGQYQQALTVLKGESKRKNLSGSYVYFGFDRSEKEKRAIPPGIYSVLTKGAPGVRSKFSLLFAALRDVPAVPEIFDFNGLIEKDFNSRFPDILDKHLINALK
jgi:hypothetical protein